MLRLNFGKKYDTELRTEFFEEVRCENAVLYFWYRTLSVVYSSNARFALMLRSRPTALFLLAYNFKLYHASCARRLTCHPSQFQKAIL